jgi:F-box-like
LTITGINRLPDEVLLEIFDFYRQSRTTIKLYDLEWRMQYAWFNLAHVCRRWRAAMFASTSRLDLNIFVGPKTPGHIETTLSSHVPILVNFSRMFGTVTDSDIWRMRAALGHRDRVREISFGGYGALFKNFIEATNYHFPALESLVFSFPRFPPGYPHDEPDIPATFLRGPDRSDLPLRRLAWYGGTLASVSGLLMSATALTDLTFATRNDGADLDPGPSQGYFLLACLKGAHCLRNLDLTILYGKFRDDFESEHSTPKDIAPLLNLTRFYYSGPIPFLNNLMSGLSAPSLQDAHFRLWTESPLLFFPRVIDDSSEEFRSVSVAFNLDYFQLLSSTYLGEIDHFKPGPSFKFKVKCSPYSFNSINSTPSTKLAMAEELTLNFSSSKMIIWEDVFFREFLRQFRSVRVLRVNPCVREVGLYLKQDDGEAILPVLEQVELSISRSKGCSDEEYQGCAAEALAAFEPCERAGRLVKVYHCEQTETQSRNGRCW